MTSGHEAEPKPKETPRGQTSGIRNGEKEATGRDGDSQKQERNKHGEAEVMQNQALKLQATNDPWKHLVTHVNLLPAEGDIGKDLGDVRNVGRKGKGCAYLDPFCGVLQCFAQEPWQYLICHVFMLFASIALLACEGGVCVWFSELKEGQFMVLLH